jgi:23S rRNA (uracil1939-C5)-methyltransferase
LTEPGTDAALGEGRCETLCAHFGECGGCASQDVPYAVQLARKEAALRELFQNHWQGPIPVEPSPQVWYYRNRIDLNFGLKYYDEPPPKGFERETVLGFKRKGKWYRPLEVGECRIFSPELPGLLASVRGWVAEHGLKAYSSRRDEGLLRILLVREGKRTGQRMVVLTARSGEFDAASFAEAVLRGYPATSVQWGLFTGKAEITAAEELHVVHGAEGIEEELHVPAGEGLRRLRFALSPLSFFQTNTFGTEKLYGALRAWVAEAAPTVLYDLYGGSGGIALSCSDLVDEVVSVESFEPASADGVKNARRNGAGNIAFVAQPVEDYLRDRLQGVGLAPGAAVVADPPRAGLHPKALKRLIDLRPARLFYVSCKPSVFAEELDRLQEAYHLRDLRAVDLFPHTPHVEVIAALEARGA